MTTYRGPGEGGSSNGTDVLQSPAVSKHYERGDYPEDPAWGLTRSTLSVPEDPSYRHCIQQTAFARVFDAMKGTDQPVDRQMAAAACASSIMPGARVMYSVTDVSINQDTGKVTVTYSGNPFTRLPDPYTYTFNPEDIARFHIPTLAGASETEYADKMISDPQRTLWELAQRAVSKGTVKVGRMSVWNGLGADETGVMGVYRSREGQIPQDLLAFMPMAPYHFVDKR